MKANHTNGATRRTPSVIDAFLALPDDEKERIFKSHDRRTPDEDAEPITDADLAKWKKAVARSGGVVGKPVSEAKRVQVSIEETLLRKADRFAKKHGMTRAQLVAKGLRLAIK